ncbi:protein of unknown function DUF399 [Solidesulfovibrio carbinoliphilus subsp. oakridgensis]|uniref:Haem-binding uptake Tiki superfamily ChaN domain-containing protein n=1 Tax=Solidesulfovibrio carbinoliphilus subsp. oakridgensis TaxID=694327 RepID=G7QBH5_9BACT|nr:protein of unknown function DUF399 [Solidesulfovibrio carbinoliphilus subsp. oakridgensis]
MRRPLPLFSRRAASRSRLAPLAFVTAVSLFAAAALLVAAFLAGRSCARGGDSLLDVHTGAWLPLGRVAEDLARCRLVAVGETHDDPAHHRLQLDVIRAVAATGARVSVGLEMFPAGEQALLDGYLLGRVDEEVLEKAFAAYWGHTFALYRDIFRTCRQAGIPLVGLNVPRGLTRKVAREGFAALTPEERGGLPLVACQVDRDYEAFLRRVAGDHAGGTDFRYFCEAQVVWDTAMAVFARDYLAAHPGRVLVVLCGTTHAWKRGMPYQVRRLAPDLPLRVILPEIPGRIEPATAGPGDCDYLAAVP